MIQNRSSILLILLKSHAKFHSHDQNEARLFIECESAQPASETRNQQPGGYGPGAIVNDALFGVARYLTRMSSIVADAGHPGSGSDSGTDSFVDEVTGRNVTAAFLYVVVEADFELTTLPF